MHTRSALLGPHKNCARVACPSNERKQVGTSAPAQAAKHLLNGHMLLVQKKTEQLRNSTTFFFGLEPNLTGSATRAKGDALPLGVPHCTAIAQVRIRIHHAKNRVADSRHSAAGAHNDGARKFLPSSRRISPLDGSELVENRVELEPLRVPYPQGIRNVVVPRHHHRRVVRPLHNPDSHLPSQARA